MGTPAGLRIASQAASPSRAQPSSPPCAAAAAARMLRLPGCPRPPLATPGSPYRGPLTALASRTSPVLWSFPPPLSSSRSAPVAPRPSLPCVSHSTSAPHPPPRSPFLCWWPHAHTQLPRLKPGSCWNLRLHPQVLTRHPVDSTEYFHDCLSNNSFSPNKKSDNHLLNTLLGRGGYFHFSAGLSCFVFFCSVIGITLY